MIGSILRVLVGFVLACIAAALVKLGFSLTPAELVSDDVDKLTASGVLSLMIATHNAVFAAPFALVAAAIGEWQSIRSWIYYALAGIAIAIAGFIALYSGESGGQATIVNNYALAAFLAAGFVGGLVYWLVAGRRAGNPDELEEAITPAMPQPGPGKDPLRPVSG